VDETERAALSFFVMLGEGRATYSLQHRKQKNLDTRLRGYDEKKAGAAPRLRTTHASSAVMVGEGRPSMSFLRRPKNRNTWTLGLRRG
jgi:hypothetical protein